MQIKKMGVEITDIPGVDWIRVQPNEHSEGGVHVAVRLFHAEQPLGFGIRELGQLIEGLSAAEAEAKLMANGVTPDQPARERRRWNRIEDVPADVEVVADIDGDPVFRTPKGWSARPCGDPLERPWFEYAPYTEVIL